jgi:hypothetical protein
MVGYIDAGSDEHYVDLAEAAAVPFENGRMARNIPAYRDIAHTPGWYWAATTGELVEFESHLEEKWLTLPDFDSGVRSGDPVAPVPGESREGLDPSLPMRQRVAAKAAELGISASTLWYQLHK